MKKLIFIALFIFTSLGFSGEYFLKDFGYIDLPSGFELQSSRENGKTFVNIDLDIKAEIFVMPGIFGMQNILKTESQLYKTNINNVKTLYSNSYSIGFAFTTPDDNNILTSCNFGRNDNIYCIEVAYSNKRDVDTAVRIIKSYRWLN